MSLNFPLFARLAYSFLPDLVRWVVRLALAMRGLPRSRIAEVGSLVMLLPNDRPPHSADPNADAQSAHARPPPLARHKSPRLVRPFRSRPALATHEGSLRHLDQRDHAPADPGGHSH